MVKLGAVKMSHFAGPTVERNERTQERDDAADNKKHLTELRPLGFEGRRAAWSAVDIMER